MIAGAPCAKRERLHVILEIPSAEATRYLARFGIRAVFVAGCDPCGPVVIGDALDLARVLGPLRACTSAALALVRRRPRSSNIACRQRREKRGIGWAILDWPEHRWQKRPARRISQHGHSLRGAIPGLMIRGRCGCNQNGPTKFDPGSPAGVRTRTSPRATASVLPLDQGALCGGDGI
jgi:hypothetical protein